MNQDKQLRVSRRKWTNNLPDVTVENPKLFGHNLDYIIKEILFKEAPNGFYSEDMSEIRLSHVVCYVDGEKIPQEEWQMFFPHEKAYIYLYEGAQGGDTGKAILGAVIMVVAVAAAWFTGGASLGLVGSLQASAFAGISYGSIALFGASLMLTGISSMLYGQSNVSLDQIDAGQSSQAYSLGGSQNSTNPKGLIPVVYGRHKSTPPLGSKSWTSWEGEKQYFNMLVVWGQAGLELSNLRIEETPIEDYSNIEIYHHYNSYGNDLKLFAKSPDESSVGTLLLNSSGWVSRTVGIAEDISIDISFNGLFSVNSESGDVGWASVDFFIEYKKSSESDDAWALLVGEPRSANVTGTEGLFSFTAIYANWNGTITTNSGDFQIYPSKDYRVTGCDVTSYQVQTGVDKDLNPKYSTYYRVSDGSIYHDGRTTISNGNRDPKIVSFRRNDLPKDEYQVRIKRLTGDSSSQYLYDEATWSTMRAFINVPAFNISVPCTVTELRIQASEQLSGYVSQLNAVVESKSLMYDGTSWVEGKTSNPASLALMTLMSDFCLSKPYTSDKIDWESFAEFYMFCEEKGYTFNFIADTETILWDRLVQIMSVGRGAPTTDRNGKWGAIYDSVGKEVKQLFSPRNSWSLRYSRTFSDMPHAIRVQFVNESEDWSDAEQYVCWDGYTIDQTSEPTKKKATDIISWDKFTGVTNWEHIYKLTRHAMANLRFRQDSITLNSDWEYLTIGRGDLVGVTSPTMMNTFGHAYIQALIFDVEFMEENNGVYEPVMREIVVRRTEDIPLGDDGSTLVPKGLQLDDTVIFSDKTARYGLAIRDMTSRVSRKADYEIAPIFDDNEHKNLYFLHEIHSANIPEIGSLVTVGLLGDEYEEYLVAKIAPSDRASAELTLIPYTAEEIEAAESGPIPEYKPPLVLEGLGGTKLPTPTIINIVSDESVLVRSSTGTSPTIRAYGQISSTSFDVTNMIYEISATDILTGKIYKSVGNLDQNYANVSDVTEKKVYLIRLRAVDFSTGLRSDWSAPLEHTVIGRTTNPPAPSAVFLEGNIVKIEQTNRPLDVVGHVIYIGMDDTDTIEMSVQVSTPYVSDQRFDLTSYKGRARIVYVRTIDELGLLSEPVSIKVYLGDIIPENIILGISEKSKNWNGTISDGYVTEQNDLSAYSVTSLFPQVDSASMFPQSASSPLFPNGEGSALQYTYSVEILSEYLGGNLYVEPKLEAGKVLKIEYRIFQFTALHPQDNSLPLFPQNVDLPLFAQNTSSSWQLMPDKLPLTSTAVYEFRVSSVDSELTVFDEILTSIDVEDKEEVISDFNVSADGESRIPIKENYFRKITNIQLTLQYIEGNSGISAEFVRNSEIYDDDKMFVLQGAVLRIFDANKQLTEGNVDITIRGY